MTKKSVLLRSRRRKADALLRDHRLHEAKAAYQAICEADRLDADARVALGAINRRLGLYEEAARCCREALALRADHAGAMLALGGALEDQRKLDDAMIWYRAAIELKPAFADAHYCLGNVLRAQQRPDEAAACYRAALRCKPEYLEALSNLGALLKDRGQYEEALKLLQRAWHLEPHSVRVLCSLGGVLLAINRPHEGLPFLETACVVAPGFLEAHHLRGDTLRHLGRFDDALASYRTALTLHPEAAPVVAAMAEILEMRGEKSAAKALIAPLIAAGSRHPRVLAMHAALSTDHERRDAAATLEQTLAQGHVDPAGELHLRYALGKLYDGLNDYDNAFAHYTLANQTIRILEQEAFRRRGPARQAQELYAWTDAPTGFWADLPRASNGDERPVFVVGMQRSGTTLAEQILASHPAVHGAGELPDLGRIADELRRLLAAGTGYPHCLGTASADMLDNMARRYLERLDALAPGAARIVDKMPGNFQRLGLISILFPKARIIHMVRDPLDTCLSIYFQKFNTTSAYAFDLADLGTHYRAYRNLMRYWRDALSIPMMEIQYESLANEPEEHIRKIIDFCGLEWDERCLRFHETRRDVNTPSYDQVRQPMYTRSIGRWKHYERHLGPLIEALGE